MSIKIMSLVWENFNRGGSEKLAMLALADWCNDQGGSLHPSISSVARKICVSESQARRIIHGFIDDGYLSVVANHGGGNPGQTRHYKINVEMLLTTSTDATPSMDTTPGTHARDPLHGCTRPLAPMRDTPSTHDTLTTINHHINTSEPPLSKKLDSADLLFDVTEQTKSDFKKLRLAKKAPITERAISAIRAEAAKAGIDLETALIECCARGWTGFKAEWYLKGNEVNAQLNKADKLLQRNREATQNWRPPEMRGDE